MSIIGDGIMLGAGGETASIFVTGLSETDTVTANKDGKTVIGKWVSNPNPAIVVPDGYTQLEYIQSSGTQYIDTGIIGKSGIEAETRLMWLSAIDDQSALGARTGSTRLYPVDLDSGKWSLGYSGNNVSSVAPVQNQVYDVYSKLYAGSQILKVDGATVLNLSNSSSYNTNRNLWMPSTNYDGGYSQSSSVRIYFMRIKMDGVLVRNFIPCKRNSDGSIGVYDLVSETFFTNSGTGTFTVGPEIPQTIDGFLIDKIKSYGTWTVTATNGTKIATETVLVDSVAVFVVEIFFLPLYIVKNGIVQNGVQFEVTHENYNSSMYGTVSYDPLYIYRHGNRTTKLTTSVNLTGASKICATVSQCSTNDVETNYARFGVLADALTSYTSFGKNTSASSISPVLDITSLTGVNIVGIFLKSNAVGTFPSVTVKDFWIE